MTNRPTRDNYSSNFNMKFATDDKTEQSIEIQEAVNDLPNRQKAIVGLLMFGYTQQQSGDILGITRVAVGLLFKKALKKLQVELED